jgi:hypothetical protein
VAAILDEVGIVWSFTLPIHIAIEGQPMCEWLLSFKTGVGLVSTLEHTSVDLVLGI